MVSVKSLVAFGLFGSAVAAPAGTSTVKGIAKRQSSGDWTCGSNRYAASSIAAAQQAACQDQASGNVVGKGKYPHEYEDYERFSIPIPSPWYEFPILADGAIFDGSTSPSTDRLIFDADCSFGILITHTGARGNDFTECTSSDAA